MNRPLSLWGIIDLDSADHFIDCALEAGVTRLFGPREPAVIDLARSRGLEVYPYIACTPFPTHGKRQISYSWSLDYLGLDLADPKTRGVLDRHRPIVGNTIHGEPTIDPFATAHPQYWARTANGSDTLSFCNRLGLSPVFPEVRERQAVEIGRTLADSGADGVQIEFVNFMENSAGLVLAGYEDRTVQEYRQESGRDARKLPADDPDWLEFRSGYVTEMLVKAREKVKAISGEAVFSTTVIAREAERSLQGLHNWPVWVQRGIIDELCLWFRTESDPDVVTRCVSHAARLVAGRIPLCVELSCYHAGSFQEPGQLLEAARHALGAGADSVGLYRHHAVDQLDLWSELEAIGQL